MTSNNNHPTRAEQERRLQDAIDDLYSPESGEPISDYTGLPIGVARELYEDGLHGPGND